MPLVAAKCTSCGGILEVDNEKDAAICKYCGTPFIIEKAVNNYVIHNSIQAENVYVQAVEKEFDISGGILKKYLGNKSSVEIPEGVFELADSCFSGTYIQNVVFPKEVKKIGEYAFADCENLESVIFNGSQIAEVGDYAFVKCKKLKSFEFSHIEVIGQQAFEETALEEVVLTQRIKEVGQYAFRNCKHLKKVKISEEIVFGISEERIAMFDGCDLLLDIEWEFCNSILDIYKEHGTVYMNDHDELYCDNILGACAFSRFFAHGGECSEILSKNIMCLFCNEKMITVKDGLFKSHRECSKCGKGIPNYDELAKWIGEK